MAATILLPGVLRAEATGESHLSVDSSGTLREVLAEITKRWPRLAKRLCDERGEIRRYVNVYVDGEDHRRIGGLDAPVREGAEIQVIPSVAGG